MTGLDVIGIPVFQAIRPMARSLSVAQGKGVTRDAARVSALMESIEIDVAERAVADGHGPGSESDRAFARRCGTDEEERGWCDGIEIATGSRRRVPLAAVSLDYTAAGPLASSNGLASGNSIAEASVAALAELVERSSRAAWHDLRVAARGATAIDPGSIDDPLGRRLLGRIRRAGLRALLWDMSEPHDVAVIGCAIVDGGGAEGLVLPPTFGAGAHPARAVALARAVTEAAQSRATMIAGARDDLAEKNYAAPADQRLMLLVATGATTKPNRAWRCVPDHRSPTVEGDLDWLLSRLAGLGPIVRVDLSPPASGLAVVRLVAPGISRAIA